MPASGVRDGVEAEVTSFRRLVGRPGPPLLLAGAGNALTARVIEEVGFEAVYVSGAGVTNSYLGAPDIGLLTSVELADHVSAIADAVQIPIAVDADTGFGNALNVQRTVRRLERAGASAIQIEDQLDPKRCGHFEGKRVIAASEMVGKVQAAVDARGSDETVIIARTDAVAVEGLEAACERGIRYAEAGADLIFVEAPQRHEDLAYIAEHVPAPLLLNVVEGGLTPVLPLGTLHELGFSVVLYANTALRGSVLGSRRALEHLFEHGDTREASDLMITWEERQDLVRKPEFDARGDRFAGPPDDPAVST